MASSHDKSALATRILRGTAVVIFFGLFLRFGGFLMKLVANRYYGMGENPGPALDAYTAVFGKIITLLIYSTMLKIVVPAFMPLFSQKRHEGGDEEAWRLGNTLTNLMLLCGAALAGLAWVFAGDFVRIFLPKFTGETAAAATTTLRWMAPGLMAQMLAIMALGVFNSYKIFSWPSAGEAAQKLTWVACIVVAAAMGLGTRVAADGTGYVLADVAIAARVIGAGYLIGCIVQAAVLLVGLRGLRRFYHASLPAIGRARLGIESLWLGGCAALFTGWVLALDRVWPDLGATQRSSYAIGGLIGTGCLYAAALWWRARRRTGVLARFAVLAAPLIVGVLFARYRDMVTAAYQSGLDEGVFSIIEFANNVVNLPTVLVAYALSIAMFPFLSDMAARKDDALHGEIVSASVRMLAVTLLPVMIALMVLSEPVMRLLFDKGKWSAESITFARVALGILATGMFFAAVENVLMQSFFSRQRMVLPTALGIGFSLATGVALFLLIDKLGWKQWAFPLVCLSYPVPRILKNTTLLVVVNRHMGIMTLRTAGAFAGKLVLLCAGVGLAAWGAYLPLARWLPPAHFKGKMFKAALAAHVAGPGLAAAVALIVLGFLLRMEEFQMVLRWVRERGWRKRPVRGEAD